MLVECREQHIIITYNMEQPASPCFNNQSKNYFIAHVNNYYGRLIRLNSHTKASQGDHIYLVGPTDYWLYSQLQIGI